MRKSTLLKFIFISLIFAAVLGFITLHALRTVVEVNGLDFRKHSLTVLAHTLEENPSANAIHHYRDSLPEGRRLRGRFWIVTEEGEILDSTHPDPLPDDWNSLLKPDKVHEIEVTYQFLRSTPHLTVMRLATDKPTYLVMANPRERLTYRRELVQTLLFLSALVISILISLLITFFYLRKKSAEAREVLLKMEQGDLKARFQIKRFDEMASLMLDFNRMASEIERLVERLHETEQSRKTLFYELSHDLRTPLTSLKAAIDALESHGHEMSEAHKKEITLICKTEISYFLGLLEDLLLIAQMEEPKYKKMHEKMNVLEILENEIQIKKGLTVSKSSSKNSVDWQFKSLGIEHTVWGDPVLFKRLIKNAIENAGRFAKSKVGVQLVEKGEWIYLTIADDGQGMSADQIQSFGKPKSSRSVKMPAEITRQMEPSGHVSLGLGAVIMKKIVELHQGVLSLNSPYPSSSKEGTQLEIRFPIGPQI